MKSKFLKLLGLIMMLVILSIAVHAEDEEEEVTNFFPVKELSNLSQRYFEANMFTGTASYTFEFNLPPGTRGMEPDLKLVYGSDNENGWFGMGWDITGLAYIERMRKNGTPVYSNTDDFALFIDGSYYELVRESGNSSGVGYYHTKKETWMRIYFDGTVWSVKTRNGRDIHFGCRVAIVDHSSYIRRWAVDQISDKCGNYISFTYAVDSSNGEYYPENITYTRNSKTELGKIKTISFVRESRSDNAFPENRWMTSRIKEIRISIDGSLVDKYVMNYRTSNCSFRSLLGSIVHGIGNLTETTTMSYQSDNGSLTWREVTNYNFPNACFIYGFMEPSYVVMNDCTASIGDINNDGLQDYIRQSYSDLKHKSFSVYFNKGNGTFKDAESHDPPGNVGIKLMDVNGDGKADYIYSQEVYLRNSSAWAKAASGWDINSIYKIYIERSTARFVLDINNDGIFDRIYTDGSGSIISNANGWTQHSDNYLSPVSGKNAYLSGLDVNGDGWTDLYCSNNTVYCNNKSGSLSATGVWSVPESPSSRIYPRDLQDFNCDGLADIVVNNHLYLNNSHGWSSRSQWSWPYNITTKCYDVNNDNLLDRTDSCDSIGLRLPNGQIKTVSTGTGKGRVLYINDDPFLDILTFEKAMYLSNAKPDLLQTVTTPNGGTVSYDYARVPVNTYLNGYGQRETFRKYVVSKITTNEGTGRTNSSYSTSFEYPAGSYNKSEKMFLGFELVKKTYPNGEYTINRFAQDIQKAGHLLSEENYSGNSLRFKQTNNWVTGTVSGSPGYKVLLGSQTTEWPGSGTNASKSEVAYTYDEYGNAIKELHKGEVSKTGDEVTYERNYINDTSNWLIGFPNREKAVDKDGNVLADKLIWYDGLALGKISKGLVSEEKSWLDNFCGTLCSNESFYKANSSRPNLALDDPHPTVKYSYDSIGNKTTTTKYNVWQGGNADQTETIEYDSYAFCLPVKYTNALGQITTFTVDYVVGKPLTITDSNQGIKKYAYDSLGRTTSEFGPRDAVNPKAKYNYANALTRIPNNQYISIERQTDIGTANYIWERSFLDGFGRVWNTEKQAPENMETEHKLVYHWTGLIAEDGLPWFKSATAAVNVKSIYFVVNPKTIVYDSLQRVLSVKEPDGNVTKYAYDGLKTTITDPNNNVTRQFQDAYGRLVRTEQDNDDGTYVTINEYDALGRLIRVLDANYNAGVSSKPIGYKYDSLGRMIYSSDPYSGETVYHYDLIGNSISKTDAKGNKLIYEYDPLNRLTKKSVLTPDGTVPTVLSRNVYDEPTSTNGVGRLTSTFIGNATLDGKYNYDLEGNVVSSNKSIGGSIYTTNITCDSLNRIKQLTYPDNEMVGYEYDTDVLSRVTGFVKYSDWRSMGIPETITCENGVTVYYLHHPGTLRLVRLNTRAPDYEYIQSFDYEYDNAGNITAISDNASITSMHTVATTQNFEYDKINRLKKSGFGTYSYDRVGNITAKEGITFGYNDSNHPYCLTTGNNGYKAVYDPNGNLIEKTDKNGVYWRYLYNAENMPVAVYRGPAKGKETLVEEYCYDAAGMRNQKKTYNGATATNTHYIYLGNNVLYETGPEKTRYILGNGREIAKVVNGKTYYTHRDHLGSSSVVTDSAGAVVNWNANHPYGENWQVSPAGTADLDKHRFTGKETDNTTGLVYFGARFYDPEVGRFITVDPSRDGNNWYAYCDNNPINKVDPDGKNAVAAGGRDLGLLWGYALLEPSPVGEIVASVATIGYVGYLGYEAVKGLFKHSDTGKADYNKQTREQLEKSKRSYEKLIQEHKDKLDRYAKNPEKHDNKGQLEKVSPEMRDKIINGRINALERQIAKQERELEKIKDTLDDLDDSKDSDDSEDDKD
jgi:RHS repeat-associated protein